MKISRSTIHVLVALEVVILIGVVALSVIHPWTVTKKNDLVIEDTEDSENDNAIPEYYEPEISEEILEKIEKMSVEEKAAQIFITTSKEYKAAAKEDGLNKTAKKAIKNYTIVQETEAFSAYPELEIFRLKEWLENNEGMDITVDKIAVAAVQDGVDMLYCADDFAKAYQGVLQAVENGEIPEAILDKAIARIFTSIEEADETEEIEEIEETEE